LPCKVIAKVKVAQFMWDLAQIIVGFYVAAILFTFFALVN